MIAESAPWQGRPHPARRLLIVEDELVTRKSLARYFKNRGWEISAASDVGEGLSLLSDRPDCVILDLMLPDKNGELILWKIRSEKLPIRVVIATGVLEPERLRAVERLKPDALLRKPIDMAELYLECEKATAGEPASRAG